ncbi:MAG: hypothetical protein ABIG70_06770 [Pseudomonadota bacterium]|nr:hypothetical protein [Gammaproteobacteria bacterium]MBU1731213.1 hypothetical protein [Gammaproteobacteria bacterium]MBU1892718.1 hypothetical protein [Gammaproteobacteria bacterium]
MAVAQHGKNPGNNVKIVCEMRLLGEAAPILGIRKFLDFDPFDFADDACHEKKYGV